MASFLPVYANVPLYWPKVEFSLFLIGQILSIPCYLFNFYHILRSKKARKCHRNHSIFILLLYNFLGVVIDLSLTQDFTRLGYVALFHPIVCLIWQYIDYGIWYGGVSMMLWISIERHILVYHPSLTRTTRQRIIFSYLPLFLAAAYAPTLFFYLVFIIPCDRTYAPTKIRCGSVCFYNVIPYWFNLYDSLCDNVIPILLIFLLSITFFFRFLKQKQRLRVAVTWRRCRKMMIQLAFVSLTYLLFDMPFVIIFLVRKLGYPTFASNALSPYITRLTLVPAVVLPYATLFGLPDLKQKLEALCFWRKNRRTVIPSTQY